MPESAQPKAKKMPFAVTSKRHVHRGQPAEIGDIIHLTPARGARQEELKNVRVAMPAEIKKYEEKKAKLQAMVPAPEAV